MGMSVIRYILGRGFHIEGAVGDKEGRRGFKEERDGKPMGIFVSNECLLCELKGFELVAICMGGKEVRKGTWMERSCCGACFYGGVMYRS